MKHHVLIIIEDDIATTYLIEQVLSACARHGIEYRKRYLSTLKIDDFEPTTIPLFVRCGDPLLEYWIDLLHRAKYPFLYYLDDNFWMITGESPLGIYYRQPAVRRSLEYAISHATLVLTNSSQLATFLLRFTGSISVLPTFFDFSLISECKTVTTDEIRIGFAGSTSRISDLQIIRPVISPILDRYPNVVFEFAGVMPEGIEPNKRIRFFPHKPSYSEYIKFQIGRMWAIGLAPLVDNEANRCKTNNKYREYGACKIAGIYTDIQPYRQCVKEGSSGILVENSTEAWLAALHFLIESPDQRTGIAHEAYCDVIEKYSVESVSSIWADCIKIAVSRNQETERGSLRKIARHSALKKLEFKVAAIQMKIASTYDAGGLSLIVTKALRKARYLAQR